MLLATASYRA